MRYQIALYTCDWFGRRIIHDLIFNRPVTHPFFFFKKNSKKIIYVIGPSGPNPEYLFRLADAMRSIAPESEADDVHLFELEKLVGQLVTTANENS